MNTSVSSDEKVMAALVHGSVIMSFFGPVIPVIIWSTQRKKSKFVAFHALQAMGYQSLTFWLWIIASLLIFPLVFILIFVSAAFAADSSNPGMTPFLFQFIIFAFIFGFMGIFFLTGIAGAVMCLMGHDFRYPLMGKWLENRLSYRVDVESSLDETREDDWVAGICHATAILQLWGAVTPILVWVTQKDRSARLRFQSMQAFVYQIVALVVYMLGMGAYMLIFFGMFTTLLFGGARGNEQAFQGLPAFMGATFFIVIILFWLVFMIGMPAYYLFAGIASFRVIRGHPFRYPLLGKLLEKQMSTTQNRELTS
jgi:uncharacterized Tic20 family protein